MQIGLDKSGTLTRANVAKLSSSKDDSAHRQIRVSRSGILALSDTLGADNLDNVLFRLEAFSASTGYVGPEAANDQEWVNRVYQAIEKAWNDKGPSYIDQF